MTEAQLKQAEELVARYFDDPDSIANDETDGIPWALKDAIAEIRRLREALVNVGNARNHGDYKAGFYKMKGIAIDALTVSS